MSRKRFIVVFILLVIILLMASALFGVLTYGLNTKEPMHPTPEPGGTLRTVWVTRAERSCPSRSDRLGPPSGPGPASPFVL